jgi:hypothetical protein
MTRQQLKNNGSENSQEYQFMLDVVVRISIKGIQKSEISVKAQKVLRNILNTEYK